MVKIGEQARCQLNFVYVFKRKPEACSRFSSEVCILRGLAPTKAESFTLPGRALRERSRLTGLPHTFSF